MESLLSIIGGIGGTLAVIASAYMLYRSNNTATSKKIREDDEKRISQLEEILARERKESEERSAQKDKLLKDFQEETAKVISEYKLEITRLHTLNDVKDEHNKALTELLQDKNPDVLNVLKETLEFLKKTDEQNKKILSYQTEILEDWRARSNAVDAASKLHKGDIMRVPPVE